MLRIEFAVYMVMCSPFGKASASHNYSYRGTRHIEVIIHEPEADFNDYFCKTHNISKIFPCTTDTRLITVYIPQKQTGVFVQNDLNL